MITQCTLGPIYTIPCVGYDCQVGVCDQVYTGANGVFSTFTIESQPRILSRSIDYIRQNDQSCRVNGALDF